MKANYFEVFWNVLQIFLSINFLHIMFAHLSGFVHTWPWGLHNIRLNNSILQKEKKWLQVIKENFYRKTWWSLKHENDTRKIFCTFSKTNLNQIPKASDLLDAKSIWKQIILRYFEMSEPADLKFWNQWILFKSCLLTCCVSSCTASSFMLTPEASMILGWLIPSCMNWRTSLYWRKFSQKNFTIPLHNSSRWNYEEESWMKKWKIEQVWEVLFNLSFYDNII